MSALRLRGVSKRFGAAFALDQVDLEAGAGEVLAVVGENGAGKSTLLNIIAGALAADSGEVAAQGGVAYIRQELALFPHLSVAENIFMGRIPSRFGLLDREAIRSNARALLDQFGRPDIDPDRRVGDLPPSSRQVVEISRALASDARVILMDEPTSSLQRADVDRLFTAIKTLQARGIAVIYVSHFLEEIREIASSAVVLRDGRSVWSGDLKGLSDRELIGHMVGRAQDDGVKAEVAPPFAGIALEVEGVGGATFSLRRGQILGIAGLVGSGRTEMVRSLFGLDPRPEGRVTVQGRFMEGRRLSPAWSIRHGLGYLSEDRGIEGLFPHLSVRENLAMTRLHRSDVSPWIERLKIRVAHPDSQVTHLSGGNQQKVLLARLLHQDAAVLLLDEPTRGIDVASKLEIYGHIRALAREGRAVLVVSSYLPELFTLCDSLAVMCRGRLTEVRPIEAWTPDTVLQEALGGTLAA